MLILEDKAAFNDLSIEQLQIILDYIEQLQNTEDV